MKRKVAALGFSLFLGLSTLCAQEANIYKESELTQQTVQNDPFYSKIRNLDKEEIIDLMKGDPELFFDKYSEYETSLGDFNDELDEIVFRSLGFMTNRCLYLEDKLEMGFESEGTKSIQFTPPELMNQNHAYFISFLSYIHSQTKDMSLKDFFATMHSISNDAFTQYVSIDELVDDFGEEGYDYLLMNHAHNNKLLDNFQTALLYYDIGKLSNRDLNIVRVRDLYFIGYAKDSYLDISSGLTFTKKEIIEACNDAPDFMDISSVSIDNGLFFSVMTEDQLLSMAYARLGQYLTYRSFYIEYPGLRGVARNMLDKALDLDNNNTVALNYRAMFFQHSKLPNDALNDYDKIIELDPNNWDAFIQKGDIYYEYGNREEAVKCFKKAYELYKGVREFIPEEIRDYIAPKTMWGSA